MQPHQRGDTAIRPQLQMPSFPCLLLMSLNQSIPPGLVLSRDEPSELPSSFPAPQLGTAPWPPQPCTPHSSTTPRQPPPDLHFDILNKNGCDKDRLVLLAYTFQQCLCASFFFFFPCNCDMSKLLLNESQDSCAITRLQEHYGKTSALMRPARPAVIKRGGCWHICCQQHPLHL